jgi:hypothetical protein
MFCKDYIKDKYLPNSEINTELYRPKEIKFQMVIAILQSFINGGNNRVICFHTTIMLKAIICAY